MKKLTVLFLIFWSSVTFANKNFISCPEIKSIYFSQAYVEKSVPCVTIQRAESIFAKIQKFAEVTERPTLFIQGKAANSFSTYGGLVVLNNQQLAWGRIRPQNQNEKIWAHELGHIVFSEWLSRDLDLIRGFKEYMTEDAQLIVQARDPNLDNSKKMKTQWKPEFEKIRDLQAPYSELFADLVGVLFAGNRMAMTEAMLSPEMSIEDKKNTTFYGFEGEYNLETWSNSEVHFFFSPARAFIGKKFLSFPMSDLEKRIVLKKVYEAILEDIRSKDSLKEAPQASAFNKSLISKLAKK